MMAAHIFNFIRSSLSEGKNAHVNNKFVAATIFSCNRELRYLYVTRSSLTKTY